MADTAKFFTRAELSCSHCGECEMDQSFLDLIDKLRTAYDKPMSLSSAYRCIEHPVEAKKNKRGTLTYGRAVDVRVSTGEAFRLLEIILTLPFSGVGFSQKGDHATRFIHIDDLTEPDFVRPTIWSY